MVEKRKQEIRDNLAELNKSMAQLQEAINKDNEPLEELVLGVVMLQTEMLKERYEVLQIVRAISRISTQAPAQNQNRQH
jgi:glutaredoxin 2